MANQMMWRLAGIFSIAALAAVAAAAALAAGPPAEASDDSVLLEPIVITAPVSPLDAAAWRLRLMLDATTPCLGCDAQRAPTRETVLAGLIRFILLPAEPQVATEAARTLSSVRCDEAGPESEFRCP